MAKTDKHEEHNETTVEVETTVKQTVEAPETGEQVAELTADLQRLQAEFQNFKRRTEQERAELMNFAKEKVVYDLLPVRDNISKAVEHLPEALTKEPWAAGLLGTIRQTEQIFEQLGVEVINPLNQEFDHNLHEAVSREGEGDTVIEVFQVGYKLNGKVIRPAMVKVGDKS